MMHAQFFSKLKLSEGGISLVQDEMHSDKLVRLLAFLIVNKDKSCTVSDIAEALWDADEDVNVSGATKNLTWRLRKVLKEKWPETEFIITKKGSYRWNPDVPIEVDFMRMDELNASIEADTDPDEKIDILSEAVDLYEGKFLSDFNSEHWIMPISIYYQNMFIRMSKDLAELLERTGDFREMERVANRAVQEEALDESLWAMVIRALTAEGKYVDAENVYRETTKMIYNSLGISPSQELREAYESSLVRRHDEEMDLEVIFHELKEAESPTGAFYCEYGVFKKIYELEARRQRRLGMTIHIALITFATDKDKMQDDKYLAMIDKGVERMNRCVLSSLRIGDVVTRYSQSQLLLMLPGCQYEMAERVMRRIFSMFNRMKTNSRYAYHYSIKEMQLNEESTEQMPNIMQPGSIRVCVDTFDDESKTMTGSVCGVSIPNRKRFKSAEELLRLLGRALDLIGRPQSATMMRRFDGDGESPVWTYRYSPEMYYTSEEIQKKKGKLVTYDIHFYARNNSTWQGSFYYNDEKVAEFASELELISTLTKHVAGVASKR